MDAPLLPTSLAGSYARPGWYWQALDALGQGLYGTADRDELRHDALTIAVEDQKRAGIDRITDGESGRPGEMAGFYQRLTGLAPLEAARRLGPARGEAQRYQIESEIAAPAGLGVVEEFLYLKLIAGPEVGVSLPGPLSLAARISPGRRYRTHLVLAELLSLVVRQELLRLVEAGCRRVQVQEPALASNLGALPELVKAVNATVHRVPCHITVHICFGGPGAEASVRRSYKDLFPAILEIEARELGLEFANREMADADLWFEHSPEQRLMAGVVDARNCYIESPEEVAARIRLLLRYVSEEALSLAPDCGLDRLPRHVAFAKLRNLVRGAAIVRREIAGMAAGEG